MLKKNTSNVKSLKKQNKNKTLDVAEFWQNKLLLIAYNGAAKSISLNTAGGVYWLSLLAGLWLAQDIRIIGYTLAAARGWHPQHAYFIEGSKLRKSRKCCAWRTGYLSWTWTFVFVFFLASFRHHIQVPPLLLLLLQLRLRLLLLRHRVCCSAPCGSSVQMARPVGAFPNRSEAAWARASDINRTDRSGNNQSKCSRPSLSRHPWVYAAYELGLQQVAVPRTNGCFSPAKCAKCRGHSPLKSWTCCSQSQSVPTATQRRNMKRWPAYRWVKSGESIKCVISGTSFQNKTWIVEIIIANTQTKIKLYV